jgi:hypothetical protein
MKTIEENLSIRELIDELLETNIFRKITERNGEKFAHKLAIWLVRYILVISSMNESLQMDLEDILLNLHKEKFKEILDVTERVFNTINK